MRPVAVWGVLMAFRVGVVGIGVALVLLGCAASGVAGDCGTDAVAGLKLAEKECGKCHSLRPEAPSLQAGPNIAGVFGGKAARRADFLRYSEAMRLAAAQGLTWDEKTLDAYIADPGALLQSVSGRAKAKHGMFYKLGDKDKRKRIVAYLKASVECPDATPSP